MNTTDQNVVEISAGPIVNRLGPYIFTLLLGAPGVVTAGLPDAMQECVLRSIEIESDEMTLGQLKSKCLDQLGRDSDTQKEPGWVEPIVDERLAIDKDNILKPYTLMAHKPNYMLLAAYNSNGYDPDPFREQFDNPSIEFDDTEARFQLSVKFPLAIKLFDKDIDIFAAYTNRSFWQVYNKSLSSPFRETNHEPEAWVQVRPDWQVFGFDNAVNMFGLVHQSNGRGGVLSRSWNRVYANFVFERDNLALSIKPWWRIPEDKDDDNPDIEDFLGYGEMRADYKWRDNTFGVNIRNVIESGFDKATVELSWNFPLWHYDYFRGYLYYFNGYGESLIDYDQHSNTIGIGISFTD